jgi:hypothetical protein
MVAKDGDTHLAKVRRFVDFLVARFGGGPAWDRA